MKKNSLVKIFFGTACALFLFTSDAHTVNLHESRLIYPEYSKKISMDFKGAQLNDVLKIFSQQSGLNFISSEGTVNKEITLYLDNVPVEEALEKVLTANGLTYEIQEGSNIFIVKPLVRPDRELTTKVFQLKHATVPNSKINSTLGAGQESVAGPPNILAGGGIITALQTVVSRFGNIVEDPRTNSLIITDLPSQFPQIEAAIAKIDVPLPQILIEVEMLDISKTTADLMGVKYGNTPLTFTGGTRTHIYPWDQNEKLVKGRFAFDDDEFSTGTINASGLSATLQFLKSHSDTKSLARPKILTLNNHAAEIQISTDEAIGTESNTSGEGAGAQTTVEAERVETGVFLTVTPQANPLTGDIILAVEPKVIQARTGGTFDGVTFRDPEERGSKSILRVIDGDTVIIGGLLRDTSVDTRTKLPFLGDIPLIGGAFRHKDKTGDARELIIFITPHIIKDPSSLTTTAAVKYNKLQREQDVPSSKTREVERALTILENQKL